MPYKFVTVQPPVMFKMLEIISYDHLSKLTIMHVYCYMITLMFVGCIMIHVIIIYFTSNKTFNSFYDFLIILLT